MAKLKKRKGYQPTIQNNWAIPTQATTGYVSSGITYTLPNNITINQPGNITYGGSGVTITGYSGGYTTYYGTDIDYESLSPVAIKHNKTGRRLIIWEP